MTTLFERVLAEDVEDTEPLSVLLLQSLMSELHRGSISFETATEALQLDAGQQNDFGKVLRAAQSAGDSLRFSSRVFAYLLLVANVRRLPSVALDKYRTEANFWDMINTEAVQ